VSVLRRLDHVAILVQLLDVAGRERHLVAPERVPAANLRPHQTSADNQTPISALAPGISSRTK
jgi:hypothetical protein